MATCTTCAVAPGQLAHAAHPHGEYFSAGEIIAALEGDPVAGATWLLQQARDAQLALRVDGA